MHIDRIEEMRLTPEDETRIATLLDLCFDTEFDGRSFFQQRHHTRLVIRDGDAVIGHMALSLRAIRMGDRLCHAVGLAEVATHPDHRGKGIASCLMQEAIAEARATIADFFVLFGTAPLYAASGFVSHHNPVLCVEMHGVRTKAPRRWRAEHLMVLPLTDLPWDPEAEIDFVGFAF